MSRADFVRVLTRQERRVDRLRREFASRAAAIIADAVTNDVFDVLAYSRARVSLEALLDEFYGAFPGDERARFFRELIDDVVDATGYAFTQEAARERRLRDGEKLVEG